MSLSSILLIGIIIILISGFVYVMMHSSVTKASLPILNASSECNIQTQLQPHAIFVSPSADTWLRCGNFYISWNSSTQNGYSPSINFDIYQNKTNVGLQTIPSNSTGYFVYDGQNISIKVGTVYFVNGDYYANGIFYNFAGQSYSSLGQIPPSSETPSSVNVTLNVTYLK
jgi:hypothetical protein